MSILAQKRCTKCGEIKLLSEFNKNKEHKDGLSSLCKKCVYENTARWTKEHPDKNHQKTKKWRSAHLQEERERLKRYREENKDKMRITERKYRETHTEERALYQRNREANKRLVGGNITKDAWRKILEKYNHTCLCCGKKGIVLTMDHVVPLIKGGSNTVDNVQPLCKSCNSKKATKIIDYRPKE